MKQIAEDVWLLRGFPPDAINVYLVEDVLIDASTRWAGRRILRQLRGRAVRAHALTHAHPDHQGASHEVCETLGIPLWCGEGDVDAMETAGLIRRRQPSHPINTLYDRIWTGPPHPVARALREGDEVAGFTVLATPGHSAGHVAYWRERDRVLITGDVFTNMNVDTLLPGLHEPLARFTPDPARNRESMRRLAALSPELACFGHGRPLRDPAKLAAFTAGLAD
jgi:glyoxylase-like metal-dependent hydrolase (beta-lactamase superfamily II)